MKPHIISVAVILTAAFLNLALYHPAVEADHRTLVPARQSAALPTVDQILDRYIQALGGKAAIQAQTSRITKGSLTAPAFGAKGTIEIYAKAPNKQLTEIVAPVLGTLRAGFNGAVAWEEENGRVRDAPGFVKREADFYLPIKMRELYPRIELKGKERIGNAEAYRLEAPRGGNPRRWYFDAETALLIRTEVRDPAGKLVNSEDYEDYRAVDGVRIAFTTRSFEDNFAFTIRLEEVKHNLEIEDAKFEKPAAKVSSALSAVEQEAASRVSAATIREVTTTLASREMEGRGVAQPGGEKAAGYIADRFSQLALEPGGDGNTYRQLIRFKIDTPLPGTSFRVGKSVFKFKTDFAIAQPPSSSAAKDASAKLVFAGYGVVSDELNRNDLRGVDVRGKIVMVLKGKPKNVDAGMWEKAAAERVVFGRLIEKGAAGFVVTYPGDASRFPLVAAFVSNRSVSLTEPPLQPTAPARWSIELLAGRFNLPPAVLISEGAAKRIFRAQGLDFAQVKQRAETGEFVSRNLNVQAAISPRIKHETGTGSNIVAFVRGSDPKLKNEAIVYTAHYDAYGKDTEGTIYPGAADNALGVGKLIAMAEAFGRMGSRPRRSVIFIATTGEEYDDLGADHWLLHPTWPLERVAANINFDGSILEVWGKLGFIPDYGFSHSDLNEVVKDVAAASNVEIIPDPLPQEEFFFRSDHYAFVRRGIPVLFLTGGPDEEPVALLRRVQEWQLKHYHSPSDTVQSDWNWEGARALTALGLITGMRIANQEAMPVWSPNSPYNRPRGTTLPLPARQ